MSGCAFVLHLWLLGMEKVRRQGWLTRAAVNIMVCSRVTAWYSTSHCVEWKWKGQHIKVHTVTTSIFLRMQVNSVTNLYYYLYYLCQFVLCVCVWWCEFLMWTSVSLFRSPLPFTVNFIPHLFLILSLWAQDWLFSMTKWKTLLIRTTTFLLRIIIWTCTIIQKGQTDSIRQTHHSVNR